ncbi:hypothetical protein [Pengzhenrongella frigida]|uniref:HPr kinase/phosphorylase C-terminal domain-containing protein n=1 Tax=Pengzhenrongella frigida TaxID=1259133 RepID=A0A4V1ZH43_9MICO|nr:hypothetical protein [Cellulomonas sp. HLT2-17]RYV50744.1 hypothetical protein EUA98_11870 [Cellulomonas sp. HLT2-17]
MNAAQLLYGLTIHSDLELNQDRPSPARAPVDVRVRVGPEVDVPAEPLDGRCLVRYGVGDQKYYTMVERPDGSALLRFHGSCDVVVSRGLDEMTVRRAPGAEPGIEKVLTTGASLAFLLYRRSHLVLHASAVDLGDHALAFVGNSGMGKSTMAALLCSDGARLITDDVLRIDDVTTVPVARLGATEIRLRKGADSLAERFDSHVPGRRTSADARQVLRLSDGARDRLPLRALVIPQPSPGLDRVVIEQLGTREALFALLGFPRILGWQDQGVLQNQFELTGALVRRIPVVVARVPWGPPFQPGLVGQLLDAVSEVVGGVPAH